MKEGAHAQPTWFIALRAVVVATVFTAFWVAAMLFVRRLDGGFSLPAWLWPLGILLIALGGALCLACVAIFVARGRGTPAPFDPPREFVASGPYRFCRNPMALGFCVTLAGVALWLRSPAALAFAAFVFLLGHVMATAWEEPHLRAKFGQAYVDYCRRTPRWIPKAPPRDNAPPLR